MDVTVAVAVAGVNVDADIDGVHHDPIVVEKAEFQKRWLLLQNECVPSQYTEKATQLRNNYACFRARSGHEKGNTRGYGHGHGHGHGHRKEHHVSEQNVSEYPTVRSMRPRIGEIFTNTEGKARKNFVAFMNKLSPQNKDSILESFIRSLVPENIGIYIDQIIKLFQEQPSYHDLYMEVLKSIIAIEPTKSKALIYEHFNNFVDNKNNIIPDNINGCLESIANGIEQTDELCDYVRWKKKMKALITLYVHVLANKVCGNKADIDKLFGLLCRTVEENWANVAAVDIYLDIVLHATTAMYSYYPRGLDTFSTIITRCKGWHDKTEMLRPSSRFKVLDIIDIISRSKKKK